MAHNYGMLRLLAVALTMLLKVWIISFHITSLLFWYTEVSSLLLTSEPGPADVTGTVNHTSNASRPLPNVVEDEVDEQLWKLDGKIQRKRDEKLCVNININFYICIVRCSILSDNFLLQM